MPRKRKDVIVISKAELQNHIDGAYREGWDAGFGEGRHIQTAELHSQNRRADGAISLAERTAERLLKAQQRKPAQPKTPAPSPA